MRLLKGLRTMYVKNKADGKEHRKKQDGCTYLIVQKPSNIK